MTDVSAVLLAGGCGSRMGAGRPKQFLELNGKPVFAYALEALSGFPEIGEIVIVYKEGTRDEAERIAAAMKPGLPPLLWQPGGETRRQSVAAGLTRCSFPVTLLHETARPLVTRETVAAVLRHPAEAVTPGCEIPFTVLEKTESNEIGRILRRDRLFNVQLPQKFPTEKLREAHRLAEESGKTYTDDSSLFFDAGFSCAVAEGDPQNIKITRPEDLFIAEAVLKRRNAERTE